MPDVDAIDAKLAGLLRQAKNSPMFFAFVAKGASDGALIVAKKKIPLQEIKDAKDACGGKVVIKGQCHGEGGKMVFKVAKEPPSSLAKALKSVIHRDAGLSLQTEVLVGEDVDEGEEDKESTPGESPAEGARFAQRFKALEPRLKGALATNAPAAVSAKLKVSEGNTCFRQHEYAKANAMLDQAELLIQEALGIPVAPPPPSQMDLSGKYLARLKMLLPVMKKAESLGGPLVVDAQAKMAEANTFMRSKQFEQALGAVQQAETLLKKALTTASKPAAAPPSPETGALVKRLNSMAASIKTAMTGAAGPKVQTLLTSAQNAIKNKDIAGGTQAIDQLQELLAQAVAETPGDDGAAAECRKKLAEIEPKYLEGVKGFGGDVGQLRILYGYAQEQAEAGQFATALKVLGRLEAALAVKPPSAQVPGGGAITPGLVKYRQALLGFEAAAKKAQAQFREVYQVILGTLPEEDETAQEILDYFDGLRSELMASVDQAISKAADVSEPINDAIRSDIRSKITEIQNDTLIQFLDKNKLASTTIASTLVGALNQIVSTMV